MITVEVVLENGFEIHRVPRIPGLDWPTNNVIALETVFDRLKSRSTLDVVSMAARDEEWTPEWNDSLQM